MMVIGRSDGFSISISIASVGCWPGCTDTIGLLRRQVWTAFASDSRNPAMPAIPTQVFKVISTGLSQFVSRGPARARWRSRSPDAERLQEDLKAQIFIAKQHP